MKREELYARFEELDKRASQGGGPDKIEKQHASGRMTARERIGMLLDKDTFCISSSDIPSSLFSLVGI